MSIQSKAFSAATVLLVLVAAGPSVERAKAATISAACQEVLDKYQSGLTPKGVALRHPNALYMYGTTSFSCGWGWWSGGNSSESVTRSAALAECQSHQHDVRIPCTLVGLEGRLVRSGVARLGASVSASAGSAQQQRTQTAAITSPARGVGTYTWCRAAVFHKYGTHGPAAPGYSASEQKNVVWMDAQSVEPMINYCVQQGGKNY